MSPQWQIRFDDGHQQRYLPDRRAVLHYVLTIGPRTASKRFEVFTESAPARLADGSPGGRTFSLAEVIDLTRDGEIERLRADLAALVGDGKGAGLPAAPGRARGAPPTWGAPVSERDGRAQPGPVTPGNPRTIIPLMPGVARPRGERRVLMQQAVVEVVRHLVIKAVPPGQRSPLFDQARDLLGEAGWGLDELFEAAGEGPARDDLFRALGLET